MIIKKEGYLINFVDEINDNFYDTARFYQDAIDEISESNSYFYEENVVLLEKVTLENIINTIDKLYKKNIFSRMVRFGF